MLFGYSALAFCAFCVFYFLRKDLRRTMLWAGSLSVPLFFLKPLISPGFLALLGTSGYYWNYFLGALVFGFCLGGTASVIFEVLFHKKLKVVPHPHKHHLKWFVLGPVVFVLAITLKASFAVSLFLGFLSQAGILIYLRKDLLWDAVISGLFLSIVYLVFYYIYFLVFPGAVGRLWFTDLSGIMIFSMPLEEFLAIFAFGMLWGPLYEGFKEYRLEEMKK